MELPAQVVLKSGPSASSGARTEQRNAHLDSQAASSSTRHPVQTEAMLASLNRYCAQDFKNVCLSPNTGLPSFSEFAWAGVSHPYSPLAGLEEPIFDYSKNQGHGRRSIDGLRRRLYIRETPSNELACLVRHDDQLHPNCRITAHTILTAPNPAPPTENAQSQDATAMLVLFLVVLVCSIILKYRVFARQAKINQLLVALHDDPELKANVQGRLGMAIPEPVRRIQWWRMLGLLGKVVFGTLVAYLVLVSSIEITARLVYWMDTRLSTRGYLGISLAMNTILATIGGILLRRWGLSLLRSIVLPSTSVTALVIVEHFADFALKGGTSTFVAMEILILAALAQAYGLWYSFAALKWLRSAIRSGSPSLPSPSAPPLFVSPCDDADGAASPGSSAGAPRSDMSWMRSPWDRVRSSGGQLYQPLMQEDRQAQHQLSRNPDAVPVRSAQVTFSAPTSYL